MAKRATINIDEDVYYELDDFRQTLVPEGISPPSFNDTIKHLLSQVSKRGKVVSKPR